MIRVENLSKSYGSVKAVDGISFEVREGEIYGLLGPNGAGKTTTLSMISGLLEPDNGRILFKGVDLADDPLGVKRKLGVVPQEVALYEHLSARENLAFFARLYGLDGKAQAEALDRGLELAGLMHRADDRVKTYSGGMKRRLNIAVALLHSPELVILDEPTVGIDPQSRNRIYEMVDGLREAGTAMIYTSHQLGEVERLCDRIVILDRGVKVAEGTLAELQRHERVRGRGEVTLRFANPVEARQAAELLARNDVEARVEEMGPNLEEIFLDLTGHALRDEAPQ